MSLRRHIPSGVRSKRGLLYNEQTSWVVRAKQPFHELKYRRHNLPSTILHIFNDGDIEYCWETSNTKDFFLVLSILDLEYYSSQRKYSSVRINRDECIFYNE